MIYVFHEHIFENFAYERSNTKKLDTALNRFRADCRCQFPVMAFAKTCDTLGIQCSASKNIIKMYINRRG